MSNSERYEDESGPLGGPPLNTASPTKWEGDFLSLCEAAKVGEQKAIALLYPILYDRAVEALQKETRDEDESTLWAIEFTDRYLLGWINEDGQVVWPAISRSDKNFLGHWETSLRNYVYHKKVFRPSQDVLDVADIVYDPHLGDEADEEEADPLSTQTMPGDPSQPGWIPGPEEVYEMKALLNTFIMKLPLEARNTFRLMLDDMTVEQIADARGIHPQTVKQHRRKIRELAIDFFSVTHPDLVNQLLLEEKEDNV